MRKLFLTAVLAAAAGCGKNSAETATQAPAPKPDLFAEKQAAEKVAIAAWDAPSKPWATDTQVNVEPCKVERRKGVTVDAEGSGVVKLMCNGPHTATVEVARFNGKWEVLRIR